METYPDLTVLYAPGSSKKLKSLTHISSHQYTEVFDVDPKKSDDKNYETS